MTLDGFRPDDVYYEKKPEKPKRDAKKVPFGLTHGKFLKTSNVEAQLFHFDCV
jgi:hypothetical protein